MARYRKPGKLNIVSVALFVGLVALIYGGIYFGPAYWRKYQISEVLDEAANQCRGRFVPDGSRLEKIEQKARKQILALGVEDDATRVQVDIRPKEVRVSADYQEVIHHPLIKRTTILRFQPELVRP
ncbi:MAG: hypothetical protein JRH20_02640, partial [Deltaproteobacteria bacterium]|nr:hypothetical protein [Deltaproteobacteria bacterium]